VSAPDAFDFGEARIIDRGYRHYDGPRTGTRGAVVAVILHSLQRALGLRRTFWAKLLPIATVALAYIPAIVFVGIVALSPADELTDFLLPTYGTYYGYVIAAIMIFVALVAPEVLCTDRRTGMLGVYLSSPLDRRTYLLAKGTSIAIALSLVCLGPPLLMLVANLLQSSGPSGADNITQTSLHVLEAGVVLTLLYTGVTMAVAFFTDRKAVASAAIMLLFLVSITITGSLEAAGMPVGVRCFSITILSVELAQRIHGEYSPIMVGVPDGTIWAAWAAWTLGGFTVAWLRFRKLAVTR
jgi:ABC-2 type transport system permease protein